ncbi:MAG: PadR family transcriptional regulator [Candidatus Heimdallarchaeota archaeon]|nr:MAG: PadR family transcriptional regulator [Candidatus Heimdallarchaeota archaeon]
MQSQKSRKNQTQSNKVKFIPATQIALLLILSEGPAHAWHIKKILDERGFEEWVDMKLSTIYKSLGILENKKYIQGEKKRDEQLSKKIYTITEIGEQKICEQIQFCLRSPPRTKSLFDLGLAGISLLPKSDALSALEEYKGELDNGIYWFELQLEKMENVEEIVKSAPNQIIVGGATAKEFQSSRHKFVVKALFERPYYIVKAQRQWVEEFIQSIREDEGEFKFREV